MLIVREMKKYFSGIYHRAGDETDAEKAYDIWSATYDDQPDNLMLALDEDVFSKLLHKLDIENKIVADIGCGTGRHWQKILDQKPAIVSGFDVSGGMLEQLRQKFPAAITHKITNSLFDRVPTASFDLIISTLTIAHVEDLNTALEAWFRIAKQKSNIIITDFHPVALAKGGKRTFQKGRRQVTVKNFIHSIESIKLIAGKYGFMVAAEEEITINKEHKHYYEQKHALHVFEKFNGTPIIYGLHLKRDDATD